MIIWGWVNTYNATNPYKSYFFLEWASITSSILQLFWCENWGDSMNSMGVEAQLISCRSAFTLATLWFVLHTELLKDPGQVQADCLVNYGIMPCGAWRLEDTWPNMAQPSTGNSHDKIDTQLYCSCTACRAHGLKLVGHTDIPVANPSKGQRRQARTMD